MRDPARRPHAEPGASRATAAARWFRLVLPRPWRVWLFDPSLAEMLEVTGVSGNGRGPARWAIARLWLQCWTAGLAGIARARFDRARTRRQLLASIPTVPDSENPMRTVLQDLRYAARSLRASPGFVLVAILTLALGTGANTAIFGVVDLMLMRPLPGVVDGDELVFVMAEVPDTPFFMGLSYPNYEDLRDRIEGFDDLLAYSFQSLSLATDDGAAERAFAHSVSANYFDVLGVEMARGRGFLPEDGIVDSPSPVLIVDHDFWQNRLGSDPDVIGAVVQLNGVPFTIVGVTPEEYLGVESMLGTQIYVSVGGLAAISQTNVGALQSRRANAYRVMGRLSDGVTLEQASASVDAVAEALRTEYPVINKDQTLAVMTEKSARPDPSAGGQFAGIAAIFLVLVALVLMIACANVANLMLARASGRTREIAVRSALGAGRLRLMRQLASESLLLGLAGGAVGAIIAYWAAGTLRAVVASWQIELPLRLPLSVDLRAVGFALLLAVGSGLIAGLLPALRASAGDLSEGLNEGARGASDGRSRQRLRGALVVAQVAVSVVLLIAAGLFVRSLQNARNSALGFETDQRLLVSYDPSIVNMPAAESVELNRLLLERARALPGVRAAGLTGAPIFSPRTGFAQILSEEEAALGTERGALTAYYRVSPGYLAAAGTRLLRGRDVADSDDANSPPVALVNEFMAARMWPDEDPIGKRFVTTNGSSWEVVGVVEQGKYMLIWEQPAPAVFVPMLQAPSASSTIVLHTTGDPLDQVASVRGILNDLAPTVPLFGVMSLNDHLRDGRALMLVRLGSGLVAAFGILGMALATIGLYGVVAYAVSQRLREFGVRIALGAEPRRLLRTVLRGGLVLAGVGTAIGVVLSIGIGRLIGSLLIETSPTDPLTYGGGIALVLTTATIATLVPAWRATRVDPIVALRDE